MGKGFQFIDSTKTDRVTRRLVRSHAMKGKNVGKVLHRRSRLELDLHAPRPSKKACTSSTAARNLLPQTQQGQQQQPTSTGRPSPSSTKSRSKSPEETPSPSDGSSSTGSSSYITTPASSVTDLTSSDFLFLDDDLVNLDWLADVENHDIDGYIADTLTSPTMDTSFQVQQAQQSLILPAYTQKALTTTLGARDSLFALAFPVQATPQSQYVISQFFGIVIDALYPPQLVRGAAKAYDYWISTLFQDRTSFHCAIALMAALSDFFFGDQALTPEAIYHLSQAIHMVNQTLETNDAVSDSNLAVVNFLVIQELLKDSMKSKAEVHLKGLQRMVELRGGLLSLGEDNPLGIKISKTAVDYALHRGTPLPSAFYRDRMPSIRACLLSEGFILSSPPSPLFSFSSFSPMSPLSPSPTSSPSFTSSGVQNQHQQQQQQIQIHPFLSQILSDVLSITTLLNSPYLNFRFDPHTLQEFLVSVGCRLIRFRPLSYYQPQTQKGKRPPPPQTKQTRIESAIHLGLIALTTTLFLQFGRRRFLRYELVRDCMTTLISDWDYHSTSPSNTSENPADSVEKQTLLWLLHIGGISVLAGPEEQKWLAPKVQELAWGVMGVLEGEGTGTHGGCGMGVKEYLLRFPWVNSLHSEPGRAMWDSLGVMGMGIV
uniref:Putative leucin zipper protein n=1 Tax=Sordaria macrospora TaxID=5147 RepID=C1KU52_SORMA|nr:putative leucin zipper protein [Sordaria macrospora]